MERKHRYIPCLDIILSKLTRNRKELDFVASRYYRINQILLSIVQIWPYEKSMSTSIIRTFLFSILFSEVFFQITTFITFKYSTELFLRVLAYVIPYSLGILQYFFFYINSDKIKQLWQDIYDNWNDLKDEAEYKIMRQYSYIGKLTTIYLTLVAVMGVGGYAFIEFFPLVLDTILPLNEPRPHMIYALTEYFIDSEKYYYLMLCHWLLGLLLCMLVTVSTFTFMLAYIHHICGLLKIACHRIEQSIERCVVLNLRKCDQESLQKIRAAMDIHRTALRCSDFLTSTFVAITIIMVACAIGTLILNWFRLMTVVISGDINDVLTTLMLSTLYVGLLFGGNYYGQLIMDHSNEIFSKAYKVRWYSTPIEMQKILLFIMLKTRKTYTLNVANLVAASMETFAMFLKISISYTMALYTLMK